MQAPIISHSCIKRQTSQVTANQLKKRTPSVTTKWDARGVTFGAEGKVIDTANRRLSRSGEWRVAFINKNERARKPESERNRGHVIMPHDFGGEGD